MENSKNSETTLDAKNSLTYEQAVERLEKMAESMERGEVPIDKLAEQLREAKALLAYCRGRLTAADEAIKGI